MKRQTADYAFDKSLFFRHVEFTLIELLIVVAIIAILAAMLLPALNKARAQGIKINCLSQEKQIGNGVMQYRNAYDDFIPSWSNANANDWWYHKIGPFVNGNQHLWICPASFPGKVSLNLSYIDANNMQSVHGYATICINATQANRAFFTKDVKGTRLRRPSMLVYAGDGYAPYSKNNGTGQFNNNGGGYAAAPDSRLVGPNCNHTGHHTCWSARHANAANFIMVDGHGESVPVNIVAKWQTGWDSWSNEWKTRWFAQ